MHPHWCQFGYRKNGRGSVHHTMRFGSTAKVLLKCKLKYYRISECIRREGQGERHMDLWMIKISA